MNFRVTHTTRYLYSAPVGLCRNQACLLPRDTGRQNCLSSHLQIEPSPSDLRERRDFFGNRLTHFAIQQPHKELQVTAKSEVSVAAADPEILANANQRTWEQIVRDLETERSRDVLAALPFLYDSPFIKESRQLADYARPSFPAGRPLIEAVSDLMQRIYHDFTYDPGVTSISTPLAEVLKNRRGVCQDFAHVLIGAMRAFCLPARYVSGYLLTHPPEGEEKLVGADASHAWVSVWAPGIGWVDFDPTNNMIPQDEHITIAYGRDFQDVSPVTGVILGGGAHQVEVAVDVLPTQAEARA